MARLSPLGVPGQLLWPRWQGLRNQWRTSSRGARLLYVLLAALGLALWAGLYWGLELGLSTFYELEVFGPIVTRKLLELLLLTLLAMLGLSSVVSAISSFYLSEDLELILSLPLRREGFFYARFLDTMLQSGWMMAFFGLPVFLAYGSVYGAEPSYYAWVLLILGCLLTLPIALGVGVASLLVATFPAQRVRELLTIAGMLLIGALVLFLRILKPERLTQAEDMESLAEYVAALQQPGPELLPSRWAADLLMASLQDRTLPWEDLGLLLSGTLTALALARWITRACFSRGWTRSQEAPPPRTAGQGAGDRLLRLLLSPLPEQDAALLKKDARVFFRDPSQWSQLLMLISLIAVYLFSVQAFPTDAIRGPFLAPIKSALAFLNLGMAGFVMAGIAVRLQFTAVGLEGRSFWILRTAPVSASRYLWLKVLPGLIPMVLVGETLLLASGLILEAPPALMWLGAYNGVILGLGISGLAVGMGALFPNFKADSAARVAAGPAGAMFMVLSLVLVTLVLALEAWPVYLVLREGFTGESFPSSQIPVAVVLMLLAGGLCAFAGIWPLQRAAKGLWEREL